MRAGVRGRGTWAGGTGRPGRQMESGCGGRGRSLGGNEACHSGVALVTGVISLIEMGSTWGRSRCPEEQGDEFDLEASGGDECGQLHVGAWRQRFENHLWRHRAEVGSMPQDGQIELRTGAVAMYPRRKPGI